MCVVNWRLATNLVQQLLDLDQPRLHAVNIA